MLLALNLLSLSFIAFLWFVAVIRRRVGERENRFALGQAAAVILVSVVATRLEALFVLSTTTVARLAEAFPRWLIVVGREHRDALPPA